ncbi:protocadherin-11 X-linked-like [Tubulanus polymorphus]|uniref:protocadherin-11 X-linked-like n=1 Tax=Tubulanus polymorphus TaxID=672921 RepID=UPI003DA54D60
MDIRLELLAVFLALMVIVNGKELLFRLAEETQPDILVGDVLSGSGLKNKFNSTVQRLLKFSFLNPNDPGVDYFHISERDGIIFTKQTIDRDTLCSVVQTCCPGSNGCYINIIVGVRPREYFTIVNVRVDILDINDNRPQFPQSTTTIRISESSPVNSTFLIPTALDIDSGNNGVQNYRLGTASGTFKLKIFRSGREITDVALVNIRPLDRERTAAYQVKVIATDGGLPELSGTCTVNIVVADANDNRPKFRNKTYTVYVKENVAVNSTIIQVRAVDPDAGLNGRIRYSLSHRAMDWIKDTFKVDENSGWISIKKALNYEGTKMYTIPIEANDMGPGGIPTRTTVTVYVLDVNDNSPTIHVNLLTSSGKAEVSEAAEIGTFVAHVLVQDTDTGNNARVSCAIDNPYFTLIRADAEQDTQQEYKLRTATKLNRETIDEYEVTVVCQDAGQPPLETREPFRVAVLDANDNSPLFTQQKYTVKVKENNSKGDFLLKVHADDKDDGKAGKVTYRIASDGNAVATTNRDGEIFANKVFDREKYDQIVFHVFATDGGPQPLSSSAKVVLNIQDENDFAPHFTKVFVFNISENALPHTPVGQVHAIDRDLGRNAVIFFSMLNSAASDSFEITRKGVITTRKRLDREHKSQYVLDVVATDDGVKPLKTTTKVYVNVRDLNDNYPIILFPNERNNTVYISFLEPVGHVITRINATDSDKGHNARLLYSIKHRNDQGLFSMDNLTGVLKVAKPMAIEDAAVHKLTIEVRDSGKPPNTNIEILNLVVDGTGKPISITGAYIERPPNNKNLIIVICLAAVSGILAIVLIIAIICIRQKDINNHNYNVKTETQRIFNNKRTNSPNNSQESSGDEASKPSGPKKEVSFSLDNDDMSDNNQSTFLSLKNQQSWASSINAKSFEQPRACSSLIQANTPEIRPISDNYRTTNTNNLSALKTTKKSDNLKVKGPKMKGLADLIKHTCDTDSETSTNHSTVDSGRGGSEEDINFNSRRNDDSCTMTTTVSSVDDSPFKGYNEHRHNNIPITDRICDSTTSSNNISELSADNSKLFNDSSYITPANRVTVLNLSAKLLNTAICEQPAELPRQTIDSQPSYKPPKSGDTPCTIKGSARCRTRRPSDTTSLGSDGYSCADMDTVLESPEKPENYNHDNNSDNISEVIDPEQLCNEINDLFFANSPTATQQQMNCGSSWV